MKQQQMYRSLLALSVADAAGENQMKLIMPTKPGPNFYKAGNVVEERGGVFWPEMQWPWTDDTQLAIGVYRILFKYGKIEQEELAREFARNFKADKLRGFGKGTHGLLTVFGMPGGAEDWRLHSENWWGPKQGSKGNGSAMRDAIIGAYFDNLDDVVLNARLSAEVTHFHDEAIAGSIAVAIAAHVATYGVLSDFWPKILAYTPAGPVRDAIQWVSEQDQYTTNWQVVGAVGNGKKVTALDTVPFALWQAKQALVLDLNFEDVINSIIEVGGDTDTVAAMVGGIIGNQIAPTQEWIKRTEPLPEDIKI